MTSRIDKALLKLSDSECAKIKILLTSIKNHETKQLDMKKLKGLDRIFRVRAGKLRIIFRIDEQEDVHLITIERRSDTTYNF